MVDRRWHFKGEAISNLLPEISQGFSTRFPRGFHGASTHFSSFELQIKINTHAAHYRASAALAVGKGWQHWQKKRDLKWYGV